MPMVLGALLVIRSCRCNYLYLEVCTFVISLSYQESKYEFQGPDSAG
eukprot:COSAG02_NODE_18226_length_952_cov_1.433763_1_plen_46_part_10